MNFFTDLYRRLGALARLLPGDASVHTLGAAVSLLSDEEVVQLAEAAAQARQMLEQVSLAASAVIGARSSRERGHSGLAQSQGHRTPATLIQQVSGVTRGEAMRQMRVGSALIEAENALRLETANEGGDSDVSGPAHPLASGQSSWRTPLDAGLRGGVLSSAQYDAIARGLGEPPSGESADDGRVACAAWLLAAEELVAYAADVPVEELAKQARALRDLLDPLGAEARFLAKYEARSFRMWTDHEGTTHGKFVFDPESAEWVRNIIDAALRPRRGGPRFVSVAEQTRAKQLLEDPRTNDQLAHDLLLDVLKVGATADAETVFGVRQAGVKLVQVVNRDEYLRGHASGGATSPTARLQESGDVLPRSAVEKHRCNTGVQPVVVDAKGDPLNVGREQRLFTPKQRIALAVRDGGCRWTACDRSASYCEAHHIDEWKADGGRTDIDRGVLLCSFHHLQLHNNGWKITRHERGPFLLHSPRGSNSPPEAQYPRDSPPLPGLPSSSSSKAPTASLPQFPATELPVRPAISYGWRLANSPPRRFSEAA